MSSTRKKRKRVENDTPTTSRRRSRDSRADEAAAAKNEANLGENDCPETLELNDNPPTEGETSKFSTPSAPGKNEASTENVPDPGAGSSQKETRPKRPLHEVTQEPANTSSENPNPDNRSARIREMIEHRKLLLSRIRLCRSAADKRLSVTKAAGEAVTDEEEILAHEQMAKIASQAAKKARGDEGVQEARSSLSLRRGSSVGKKMNAALSTLAPGAGLPVPAGTIPAASMNVSNGTLPIVNPAPIPAVPQPEKTQPVSSSGVTPTVAKASAGKTTSTGKTAKPTSSLPKQSNPIRQPTTGKSFKSIAPPAAARPSSAPKLDQVRPRAPPTKVQCPEAVALRAKRDAIQARLELLLEKQQQQQRKLSDRPEKVRRTPPPNTEIPSKVELAQRRKTHWDRLLHEMNWLATDFIEERKWKMSSARTLGAALRESGFAVTSLKTEDATRREPSNQKCVTKSAKRDYNKEGKRTDCDNDEKQYTELSQEDARAAKKVAKLTASMVSELVTAITEANTVNGGDDCYIKALSRYKDRKIKIIDGRDSKAVSASEVEGAASDEDNPQCGDVDTKQEEAETGPVEKSCELTFSEISKRMQKLFVSSGKNEKISFKEFSNATTEKKFSLSDGQKESLEFVDGIWNTSTSGAVLRGMPISGKTVVSCALFWKNRLSGVQLLVCPPNSLFRWQYEISHFKELRPITFGTSGGIGCCLTGEESSRGLVIGNGDVVLCEFSSLSNLMTSVAKSGTNFATLCVDCRQPEGMFGSMKSEFNCSSKPSEWQGNAELIEPKWWEDLTRLSEKTSRRLVIEYCDPDLYSLGRTRLGHREQLDILSLRVAFLLGAELFRPTGYSLQRTIISWARHHDKRKGENKCDRVKRILAKAVSPFLSPKMEEREWYSGRPWKIRRCEMTDSQRNAYDQCCLHLRGALSSSLNPGKITNDAKHGYFHAVSVALFRLRQLCLTSTSWEKRVSSKGGVLPFVSATTGDSGTFSSDCSSSKIAKGNASQPDVEMAEILLSSSGKLLELVAILRDECGFSITCDESIQKLLDSRKAEKATGLKSPLRVVILVNLPRTQWLVSILLGSLGLRHKLLHRDLDDYDSGHDTTGAKNRHGILSWAEAQTALVSFNAEDDVREVLGLNSSPEILVIAPDALASWHGGVGIDKADLIISLDENWSGGEMGTLEASVFRWNASSSFRKSTSRFMRLVCEETIEAKILESTENDDEPCFNWPLNPCGRHLLEIDVDPLIDIYQQGLRDKKLSIHLPGLNILRLRGEPLDSVLLSRQQLAPFLQSGSNMYFLPFQDVQNSVTSEGERRLEILFLRDLLRLERGETFKALSAAQGETFKFQDSWKVPSGVAPPKPLSFPGHIMSRSDVRYLSSRWSLERQILFFGRHSSNAGHISLARLPDTGNPGLKQGAIAGEQSSAPIEVWGNSGMGTKPEATASSLLSYRSSTIKAIAPTDTVKTRRNVYSSAFSSAWDGNGVADGNQGCEPSIFLPPVPPKIQLAPQTPLVTNGGTGAFDRHSSPKLQVKPPKETSDSMVTDLKRKESVSSFPPGSKRPRVDGVPSKSLGGVSSASSNPLARQDEGNVSTKRPSSSVASAQASTTPDLSDAGADDYGLLGRGVVPFPADSALLLANESCQVSHSSDSVDFLGHVLPCDEEESEYFQIQTINEPLGLVALFVKKRSRLLQRPYPTLPQSDPRRPIDPPVPVTAIRELIGDDVGQKAKKKSTANTNTQIAQVAPSAFTLLPTANQGRPAGIPALPVGKDGPKHRMLATYASRQYGTGLSMFESASFRIAMMQVQSRIRSRVDRAFVRALMTSESGPGVPLSSLSQPKVKDDVDQGIIHFTSIVQPSRSGSTGDTAKALSASQRTALRRAGNSPCRVDFGPFESGFLALLSGMTGISPARSRLGVSLPMGVKVTHSSHEQSLSEWSREDDKLLQKAAVRFGMNWIVVARVLSGAQGFIIDENSGNAPAQRNAHSARSARQCRDRWQSLARSNPSMAGEVRKSEKMLRENALKLPTNFLEDEDTPIRSSAYQTTNCILLSKPALYQGESTGRSDMDVDRPSTARTEPQHESAASESTPLKTKRSLGHLQSFVAKRQIIPLTLPPIPPGTPPNQPVPSHPSHMQSVQSSVAAQWSNGRTEMWPLQILSSRPANATVRKPSAVRPSPVARPVPPVPYAAKPSSPQRSKPSSSSSSSAQAPRSKQAKVSPPPSASKSTEGEDKPGKSRKS